MSNIDKVIVALDQMDDQAIFNFLSRPENSLVRVKIGLELFLKYGQALVKEIQYKYDKKIFLDLKLHDIPETVFRAIKSLEGLPIEFLTIHLSGGEQMLKAAVDARNQFLPQTKLLGISFLTSLGAQEIKETFKISHVPDSFQALFKLADKTKIDGVVMSAHEVQDFKQNFPNLKAVTPGIRFLDEINQSITQDQKRVMDPKNAFLAGADYLVMGRSLTKADDLKKRLELFL